MLVKFFTNVFLGLACIAASQTLVYANIGTISIGVVVPERAQDQKCVVGFTSNTHKFTSLKSSGCSYNSTKLMQTAYQKATSVNNQGFVTVVITAP